MALATGEVKPGFAADMHGAAIPSKRDNATVLLLPTEWDGEPDIPWGRVWLKLGCDFGKALLRVAIFNEDGKGGGSWRVLAVTVDAAKPPERIDPWKGASKVSICRQPTSATDTADAVPVGYAVEGVLKQ